LKWIAHILTKDIVAVDPGYPEGSSGRLELLWGEGFMSPGGPAEVARILSGCDISGLDVLDVGSGTGGIAVLLVHEHGAGSVVGIDIDQRLIDLSTDRLARYPKGDLIRYQTIIAEGPLPFPDAAFDMMFSKDAILHVHDKERLFKEVFRVLRPGGCIMMSDWLCGAAATQDDVDDFVAAAGHTFQMATLQEMGNIVASQGFAEIALEDRGDWYLAEAQTELARLRDLHKLEFIARWGDEVHANQVSFWEVVVASVTKNALRPGHLRARKPM
jgi:ubiquinone/menaquinone biosynthesis C-methylase UbiE